MSVLKNELLQTLPNFPFGYFITRFQLVYPPGRVIKSRMILLLLFRKPYLLTRQAFFIFAGLLGENALGGLGGFVFTGLGAFP